MKFKINKKGHLCIERKGIYKEQYCHFTVDYFCCDSCALFEEPVIRMKNVHLSLCKKEYMMPAKDFIDER